MVSRSAAVPMNLFNPYMEVEEFGEELIRTGDLDPVYIMLYRAKLEKKKLAKWLLAYWWFYHSGVASMLTDQEDFYLSAKIADTNGSPRGVERRHFRGRASRFCIHWFSENYPEPYGAVKSLERARALEDVKLFLKDWPMFGPWMAFKIGDMLERVLSVPIKFEDEALYDSPRSAAAKIAAARGMKGEREVVQYLLERFSSVDAPPNGNRKVNLQEIETILCKWGSHASGNYAVGYDTREIREHLEGWGPLATKLKELLP